MRPLVARARAAFESLAWVVKLVYRSARNEVLLICALEAIGAAGVFVELLVARDVLQRIVDENVSVVSLLPLIIPLAIALALVRLAAAAEPDRSELAAIMVDREITDEVLRVTSQVPLDQFERPEFHDELYRVLEYAIHRPYDLVHALSSLIGTALTTLAVVGALSAVNPIFLPVGAVAFIPVWIALHRSNRELYQLAYEVTPADRERESLRFFLTDPRPAAEARGYGVGEAFRRRHHELYGERIHIQRQVARRRLLRLMGSNAIAAVVAGGLIAAILGITGSGGLHIADIVITAAALQRLGATLGVGFGAVRTLDEARPYLDDLEHLLVAVPARSPAGRAEPLPPLEELRCEGVHFRYPTGEEDVLEQLDLVIRPGTVTAVVGENGIGKTTLAKLLCGLYAPTGGRITWNGSDVADLGRERLAASTAMLFQDFNRYRMTVRHNVGAGDVAKEPEDHVIDPALQAASAKEIVDELPDGNDTVLGVTFEGGTDLSSGQWQRLALARALFRTDAQVLVLDEPTASMDAKTERAVFDSLRSWASGRAVVVITHRPLEEGLVDEVLRPHHEEAHHVVDGAHHHHLRDSGD